MCIHEYVGSKSKLNGETAEITPRIEDRHVTAAYVHMQSILKSRHWIGRSAGGRGIERLNILTHPIMSIWPRLLSTPF